MLHRGHSKASIQWTKGHAAWKMVAEGVAIERGKLDNDEAELFAHRGVAGHGEDKVARKTGTNNTYSSWEELGKYRQSPYS